MEGIEAVFQSREAASAAVRDLRASGFSEDKIIFLTREATDKELAQVPATYSEEPGIGKAITTAVGGALGAGAGIGIGAALAGMLVPGVGTVFAAGIGAAALLGVGGAVAGNALGERMETRMDEGVPRDDIEQYHDLLRQNRTIVVVDVETAERGDQALEIMKKHGGAPFEKVRKAVPGTEHAA